jgi:hypothetical protein
MVGQILPNNNEKCYSNFSPHFSQLNTAYVYRTIKLMNIRRNVNLDGVERVAYNDAGQTATKAASAAAICYLLL